jgi:UDP-3-O-acyl-N-acetylglucosamine deacetylase
MLLDAIDHRVAVGPAEAIAEEFHHKGIGVHDGKRFPILVTPPAQADAVTA